MKKIIIIILRICIVFIVALPVLFPYVNSSYFFKQPDEHIKIYLYNKYLNTEEKFKLKKVLKDYFKNNLDFDYIIYGNTENSILQDYEDLINKVINSDEKSVIISHSNLFGEEADIFNSLLKKTSVYKENKLYLLNEDLIKKNENKKDYVAISNIFLPKTIFVGNEVTALISIIGKVKPYAKLKLLLEIYNGNLYLNSKEYDIRALENGNIKENLEIPVQFFETGSQTVIAKMHVTPNIESFPLNSAFSLVNVTYKKTTILHIAFSPDWSLRNFRQKLKFWPNLDLLSYYILREMTSDQSIKSSELSLIEFPSETLFGSQLKNLHGIIAQNFLFGDYLGERETQNLIEYIKQGGRLVIQAGGLSFKDQNQIIQELNPCKNQPNWDTIHEYNWTSDDNNLKLPPVYQKSLNYIKSHATFTHCIPKENVIVLAYTKENHFPVLTAMPLEKGIILSFLAGDWLYGYTQILNENINNKFSRVDFANASDSLFEWMIEFLQRKQDSGVRAPEFSGPRIYSEDKYIKIKTHGGLDLKKDFLIQSVDKKIISSKPFILNNLNFEMLKLDKPLQNILTYAPLNSLEQSQQLTIHPLRKNEQLFKFKTIPVFSGKAKNFENYSNPYLFEGIHEINKNNLNIANFTKSGESEEIIYMKIPILNAYPWLLAFALSLLAFEQFLSRIYWKGK